MYADPSSLESTWPKDKPLEKQRRHRSEVDDSDTLVDGR